MTPDSESGEPCHEYRGAALPRTRRPLLDGAAAEAFLALIIDAASETFERKRRKLVARIKDIRRSTIAGFLDACAASGLRDGGGGGAELLHVQAARALLASRGASVEAVETDRRGDDLVHDLTLGT